MIAVVGAEDEIGVLRWPLAATAVCRSPIIRSTASTDCARLRKSRSIAAMSDLERGGNLLSHLRVSLLGAAAKAGVRGGRTSGKASASVGSEHKVRGGQRSRPR